MHTSAGLRRTNHSRWRMLHILNILSHLGLAIAASVGYAYHLSTAEGASWATQGWRSASLMDNRRTDVDVVSCSHSMAARMGSVPMLDMGTRTLLVTGLVVGALGLVLNGILLIVLLAVEPNRITLTEGEQHWRKQVVTLFGCVLNLLLASAGVGLATTLGTKTAAANSMIAPLIWASIQAPLAAATAVMDALKNHQEGRDLLD